MKCKTKYCRNKAYKNPNTGYQRKHCSKCRKRQWRNNRPYSYYYSKLKDHAREREIEFTLTLQDYKNLWQNHPEKWQEKIQGVHGMTSKTWTVDRIYNEKGYEKGNIQILSLRRNVLKYVKHDKFHLEVEWTHQERSEEVEEMFKAPF